MKRSILLAIMVSALCSARSQSLSVNTDGSTANISAMLDVKSTAKGILIPRMSRTERNTIASPATGLLIFQNAPDSIGFYYYTGSKWSWMSSIDNSDSLVWKIKGNAGTLDASNFIGTTDNIPFNIRVNNQKAGRIDHIKDNTFFGYQAGSSNVTGLNNTAVGYQAFFSNGSGSNNTAMGIGALLSNSSGNNNTSTGMNALAVNFGGTDNTANGYMALNSNASGVSNTASGSQSLQNNTGSYNTAYGMNALFSNRAGQYATAIGTNAMQNAYSTLSGFINFNVAVGFEALKGSANPAVNSGNNNTALGYQSLSGNSSGSNNTATGLGALSSNATGSNNTASGTNALYNSTGDNNTAVGNQALVLTNSGTNNTAIGNLALFSNTGGFNNTALGMNALYFNRGGNSATAIGTNAMQYAYSTAASFINFNVAVGYEALRGSVSPALNQGNNNTAIGYQSLWSNSSGFSNTATGLSSLYSNNTGSNNTANGKNALYNSTGDDNTAIGNQALATMISGNQNTALGSGTTITGGVSNATVIGYNAIASSNDKIRLGNPSVTVIEGQVAYSFPSDGRFKYNINEDDVKGLDFIMKLKPVVYNFDTKKFDDFLAKNLPESTRQTRALTIDFKKSSSIRQSGFVAQDVEKAMVATGYDFNGVHKPANENDNYSIAYSLFVVPLVKAVQEQQQMISQQSKEIQELKSMVKQLMEKK